MNKEDMKVLGWVVLIAVALVVLGGVAQYLSKQPRKNNELKGAWEVTWEKVNLREGPGCDTPIIGELEKGDVVRASGIYVDPLFEIISHDCIGADAGHFWLSVSTATGRSGYVTFASVERYDLQEYSKELKGEWVIQWSKVNLRTEPDINAEVAKSLERGATVKATGYYLDPPYDIPVGGDRPDPDNVWLEVECAGEKLYMCSTAIRIPN